MINRSTLMPNAISPESFSKFLAEFVKRSDHPLVTHSLAELSRKRLEPGFASLIIDAICLWEAEKWRFLTMADNARLNPTSHVFPNSEPSHIRL